MRAIASHSDWVDLLRYGDIETISAGGLSVLQTATSRAAAATFRDSSGKSALPCGYPTAKLLNALFPGRR